MRQTTLAAIAVYGLPLIASLSACGNLPPERQAKVTQALAVACDVDGAVVPLAQPVAATLGRGSATAASVDGLLLHPAVVAACRRLGGMPAGVTPAAVPPAVPVAAEASPG
jgi:hypothetical protein